MRTGWVAFVFLALITGRLSAQLDYRLTEVKALAAQWKQTPAKSDSAFVADHSEDPAVLHYFHEGIYPDGTDSSFRAAKKGDVIGPFEQENSFRLYKISGKKKMPDSVQVSHILYAYAGAHGTTAGVSRTKEQAKKSADSLCLLIKQGKVVFENIVEQVTDDPGSLAGNKGNYGWFTRESGFVEEFKNAGFDNPVGATVVTETVFGYHIIQVEAKSKEWNCLAAWEIVQAIDTCLTRDGQVRQISEATYPGGKEAMDTYIYEQIQLFDSLNSPRWNSLVLMCSIDILEDGSVANVNIFFNPLSGTLAEEQFTALLMAMPKWIPAQTCDGPVFSNEVITVMFH